MKRILLTLGVSASLLASPAITLAATSSSSTSSPSTTASSGSSDSSSSATGTSQSKGDCAGTPFAMGARFQQSSAEVRALRYQAYNVATRQLDEMLAKRKSEKNKKSELPPAIVVDLDETVLDNSAMAATGVLECDNYTSWGSLWQNWVDQADAPLVAGAKAFLDHANAKGVTIYYVSNRVTKNLAPTLKNLKLRDLPQATAEHVKLLGPPKAKRDMEIAKTHDILMLLGDSMHDFDGIFAKAPLAKQRADVKKMKDEFGSHFIVLPNAIYGSWQKAQLQAAQGLSK